MDDIVYNTPMYFCQDDKLIKDLIYEQGSLTAEDNFTNSHIRACLQQFTDGYVIIGQKQYMGYTKSKRSRLILKGYCMFTYNENFCTMEELIFCVKTKYLDMGYDILNCVKDFGYDHGATLWIARTQPNEKMINYYLHFGFIKEEMVYDKHGNKKIMRMRMKLEYPKDDEDSVSEDESEHGDDDK
jgi:hypothetical protein